MTVQIAEKEVPEAYVDKSHDGAVMRMKER
jgi:hypothetical protein